MNNGETMIIAVTGTSGNIGGPTVDALLKLDVEYINVLMHSRGKRTEKFKKAHKRDIKNGRLRLVYGSLSSVDTCRELIAGANYVVNLAAVIPPLAEFKPLAAVECNEHGADALCTAIEQASPQPKLIHFSTIALYAARSDAHPFARTCDPLLVSPYDMYAATKLRGEFRVLESDIAHRVVLRESAVMYDGLLESNIHDGLMFQTPFNTPLEWVSAEDTARLVAAIIACDAAATDGAMLAVDDTPIDGFWNKVYNISGFPDDRVTGFEVYDRLMQMIGAGAKSLFEAKDNVTRNFHGVWFADSDILDNMFGYRTHRLDDYVKLLLKSHRVYSLGKLVPKRLIKKALFDKLKKCENAPAHWAKTGQTERMIAYYGGADAHEKLGGWDTFPLLCEGKRADGSDIDYASMKDASNYPADPMFMTDVPDSDITPEHLRRFAEYHGGKLISDVDTCDMYAKLEWETQDGERFTARPYTVLRAGHWFNPVYKENVWDFDRLAKKDAIFAYQWYDTHAKDENNRYYYDERFCAKLDKF